MKLFIFLLLLIPSLSFASAVSDFNDRSHAPKVAEVTKTPKVTGPRFDTGGTVVRGDNKVLSNFSRKLDSYYNKSLEDVERIRQPRHFYKSSE
jgi:hypothetical protein